MGQNSSSEDSGKGGTWGNNVLYVYMGVCVYMGVRAVCLDERNCCVSILCQQDA